MPKAEAVVDVQWVAEWPILRWPTLRWAVRQWRIPLWLHRTPPLGHPYPQLHISRMEAVLTQVHVTSGHARAR
ncbi:MAG: hypothetical protein WA621_06170 [Candidatus Acidiferrum sp.]